MAQATWSREGLPWPLPHHLACVCGEVYLTSPHPHPQVSTLRAADAWAGVFCESDIFGTLAPSAPGTAHALTDHNIVTAAFALPAAAAGGAAGGGGGAAAATAAFEAAVAAWREPSGAQEARLEIRRDSLRFAETRRDSPRFAEISDQRWRLCHTAAARRTARLPLLSRLPGTFPEPSRNLL